MARRMWTKEMKEPRSPRLYVDRISSCAKIEMQPLVSFMFFILYVFDVCLSFGVVGP